MTKRTCCIADCGQSYLARGWCRKHYYRWKRHGDPLFSREQPSAADRYFARIDRSDASGCWLWTGGRSSQGYGALKDDRNIQVGAHRFGWELYFGPIPDALMVCHSCDNPPCQNPAHWFLGTALDNMRDKITKGRARIVTPDRKGESNGRHQVTVEQVTEIRHRYASGGIRYIDLAQEYAISVSQVGAIVRGTSWTL